jgi:hypothetical protein
MGRIINKRKNLGRIGLICLILLSVNIVNGQHLERIYTSQIGVHELTGHNDGKEVESYLKVCGLGKGQPWCAAFVAWCHQQAGIKAPLSGYCPDWFRTNVVYKRSWKKDYPKANPNMVFGLWFQNMGRVAHEGFIEKEDANAYYTVEGNGSAAGSREGNCVGRHKRLKSMIYIISKYQ